MLLNDVVYFKDKLVRALSVSLTDSAELFLDKKLCLQWANDKDNKYNFGDKLNPLLIEKITGMKTVCKNKVLNISRKPVLYFIGSILDNLNNKNAVICGAGFQKETASIRKKPHFVLAVRGPLSRNILLENGAECPAVYGDPAILLPYFLKKKINKKKWDVGIIAHYADKVVLERINITSSGLSYKIIDVESPINEVIDDICSSRYVLSSSLHGIIVAHAYMVPATRIRLSENVIGGSFKFRDYSLSAGGQEIISYHVNGCMNLKHCVKMSTLYDLTENSENLLMVMCEYFGVKNVILPRYCGHSVKSLK